MAVTTERRALLLERIGLLDDVLFRLAAGEVEISISTGNNAGSGSVTYRQTDESKVRRLIDEYKRELGQQTTMITQPGYVRNCW